MAVSCKKPLLWRLTLFMFPFCILSFGKEWQRLLEMQKYDTLTVFSLSGRIQLKRTDGQSEVQAFQGGPNGRPADWSLPANAWCICGTVRRPRSFQGKPICCHFVQTLLWLLIKIFTLSAGLVAQAFALSAFLRLPSFSQAPSVSFLASVGPPPAWRRKSLKKKTSPLPRWSLLVRK